MKEKVLFALVYDAHEGVNDLSGSAGSTTLTFGTYLGAEDAVCTLRGSWRRFRRAAATEVLPSAATSATTRKKKKKAVEQNSVLCKSLSIQNDNNNKKKKAPLPSGKSLSQV